MLVRTINQLLRTIAFIVDAGGVVFVAPESKRLWAVTPYTVKTEVNWWDKQPLISTLTIMENNTLDVQHPNCPRNLLISKKYTVSFSQIQLESESSFILVSFSPEPSFILIDLENCQTENLASPFDKGENEGWQFVECSKSPREDKQFACVMFGGYKLEWIDFKFSPARGNQPAKLSVVRKEDYKVYKNMEVSHGSIKLFIHERDRL